MMTPTLLNKKDNFLTRSRLVPSHDSLVPLNAEPAFKLEAERGSKTRHGLFRELNKVELAVEPSDYSDEALLELIAQRDPMALSEIYDRHAPMMYNLIVRIVKEPASAEHILQESFWQVWEKAESYSSNGAAAAWLYRIARNKSLDYLRRQKVRPVSADKPISEQVELSIPTEDVKLTEVEMDVERTLQRQQVQDALTKIPDEQRYCLELAYFNGMTQRQIAEHTQTPLGTIKTRVSQGLNKLERILRTVGYRNTDFLILLFLTIHSIS